MRYVNISLWFAFLGVLGLGLQTCSVQLCFSAVDAVIFFCGLADNGDAKTDTSPCPEFISPFLDDPTFCHENFSQRGSQSGIRPFRLHVGVNFVVIFLALHCPRSCIFFSFWVGRKRALLCACLCNFIFFFSFFLFPVTMYSCLTLGLNSFCLYL